MDVFSDGNARAIFEGVPEGLVIHEPDTGRILHVNEAFCEMNGYERSDLVGRRVSRLTDAEWDPPEDPASLVSRAREEGTVTVEWRNQPREGDPFWVEVDLSLVELAGSERVLACVRDVSERKASELAQREFRAAVENAGHAIYTTDVDGAITYVNPRFEELTGYEESSVLGRTPRILKSGEHGEAYYHELWETILNGETWSEEVQDKRRSGELYTASQTISPITNGDGDLHGFVAIQNDVTDHRLHQQRLKVLSRVLRHNLRNDLNAIVGYAELLAEHVQDASVGEYVGRISETATDLLVESTKAREVEKEMELARAHRPPVGVDNIVARVASRLEDERPNGVLAVDYDEATTLVNGALETAVWELIENAVDHTDARRARLSVTVGEETVTFTVSDEGEGLPDLERETLERGTEDQLLHGDGIGLWLVYWVVNGAGGTIDIEENDPTGTVVHVTAPTMTE